MTVTGTPTSRRLAAAMTLAMAAGLLALLPTTEVKADEPACGPSPLADRAEVPAAHRGNVDCAYQTGITGGFSDGTYRPAGRVTRDQMAAFIARTLDMSRVDLPPAGDQGFTDVAGNTHEDDINRLAAADIVEGFQDNRFHPGRRVTRDQLASFVLRAVAFGEGVDVADLQGGGSPFTDIAGNAHEPNIEGAYNRGLVTGRTATTYDPRAATRRDQMASLLIRGLDDLVGGPPYEPASGTHHNGFIIGFDTAAGYLDVDGELQRGFMGRKGAGPVTTRLPEDFPDDVEFLGGQESQYRLFYDEQDVFYRCDDAPPEEGVGERFACEPTDLSGFAAELAEGKNNLTIYNPRGQSVFYVKAAVSEDQRVTMEAPEQGAPGQEITVTVHVRDAADGSPAANRLVGLGGAPDTEAMTTDEAGAVAFDVVLPDDREDQWVSGCVEDDGGRNVCIHHRIAVTR